MDTALYFVYAAVYIFLIGWGIKNSPSGSFWNASSGIYLVLFGLIYDNLIIAAGKFIGEGELLRMLNYMRYWFHAFFTPLLVLFSWGIFRQAGIGWAQKSWVFSAAAGYTVTLIAMEIILEIKGLTLIPVAEYGLLRYTSAESGGGPPLMVLFVTAALLAAGGLLWKKTGWKWMFIGAFVILVGSAVPIPIDSSAVTNGFELLLLVSLTVTKVHWSRTNSEKQRGENG